MSAPFKRTRSGVRVGIGEAERHILAGITQLIEDAGDAGGRFDYQAFPDDADAAADYRSLLGDTLANEQSDDRQRFADTLEERVIDDETAMAWMRVIGDARIALAHRVGIEDDGWEEHLDPASPEVALLHYLGYLQDALVGVL